VGLGGYTLKGTGVGIRGSEEHGLLKEKEEHRVCKTNHPKNHEKRTRGGVVLVVLGGGGGGGVPTGKNTDLKLDKFVTCGT